MKLSEQKLEPFMLPPGTLVGPWKVKAYAGGGAYGLVFRAVRAGDEAAGEVALKVACYPGDERFQREGVLLSRVHHPSVPRLLGQGQWKPPRGEAHPFIVIEWVEGLALYTWAEWRNASSHQVLRVLGQLAGAVAATHAAGGVHRDIKGGNIRVSLEGARAVLMDFGAGTYAGAAPLTKGVLPPGTDDYRSPEAREYALQRPRGSTETYVAQPADDVFALGVCAYRLVTGWYLPPVEVMPGDEGPWRMVWRAPRPPAEMNPRVAPQLSELIVRMLSREPGERPSAAELAEALEEAVRKAGADADRPLFPREQPVAAVESAAPLRSQAGGREGRSAAVVRSSSQARRRTWAAYAACALFGAVVSAVAVGWGLRPGQGDRGGVAPAAPGREPVGLGDTSLKAPTVDAKDSSDSGPASRPVPQTPLDDQQRAPHCVPGVEFTINEGCWVEVPTMKPPCKDPCYEWQGRCYVPSLIRRRKPTSDPPWKGHSPGPGACCAKWSGGHTSLRHPLRAGSRGQPHAPLGPLHSTGKGNR